MSGKNLQRQRIIRVAHGAPKGDCLLGGDQYVNGQPPGSGPYLRTENLDGTTANASPATITDNEELTHINLLRLFSKKRVRNDFAVVLKKNCVILSSEPISHSLFKLCNGHGIPMTLVPYQLMVQFRKETAIIQSGASKFHVVKQFDRVIP